MEEIVTKIKGHNVIGLDAGVFILHFKGDPTYHPTTTKILSLIEAGQVKGVTSILTLFDLLEGPKRAKNFELVEKYTFLLATFPNLLVVPIDQEVVAFASTIKVEYKLSSPTAIQVASAILKDATIFITIDESMTQMRTILEIIVIGGRR